MKHILTLIHHQLPQSSPKKRKIIITKTKLHSKKKKNKTKPKIRHWISRVTVVLNLEFLLLLRTENTVRSLSEKVSVIKNSFYVQFKVA